MNIAYVTNYFHIHQLYLADELYALTDGGFTYIEICRPYKGIEMKLPSTFSIYDRPYYFPAWKSESNKQVAMDLCRNVDVLLCSGNKVMEYEKERLKTGKLTFEPCERQLKRGFLNAFSKTSLSYYAMYFMYGHKNLYKLCASAYCANDAYFLHPFFKGRCYKWGYFPLVPNLDIEETLNFKKRNTIINILCVARFIDWKRLDIPILMSKKLKDNGYHFKLTMVGEGPLKRHCQNMVTKLDLEDCVHIVGSKTNEEVYELMKCNDIFVFTSNKREGWGAVLNEAMSNGCACVASELIGAVPYLIKHMQNGLIFRTGDVNDFYDKVRLLIEKPDLRHIIQANAMRTMTEVWSPQNAAMNLIRLSSSLLSSKHLIIKEGPCSLAEPLKGKTFSK